LLPSPVTHLQPCKITCLVIQILLHA
jgi:hypothetical protein